MRLSCELSPGECRKTEGKVPLDSGLLLLQCSESAKEIEMNLNQIQTQNTLFSYAFNE